MADISTTVSAIAERYATALFELAREADALDAVAADLDRFNALVALSDDFARLIRSPVFTAEDQLAAVSAVLAKTGIGPMVVNLAKLAARNRRLFALPDIATAYRQMLARHRGEASAEVASAAPLSDAERDRLKAALKGSLGKDVALDETVDPALIGGLVVKIGSRMIDTSIRTKLNALKTAMKEVG